MFVNNDVYAAEQKRHAEEIQSWRDRYDSLLEKYHSLKIQGAAEPAPALKPLEKKPRDSVMEVIGDVAGTNSKLRAVLGSYARRQRACDTPDDEIIKKLLNWDDDDSGVPE